LQEAGRKTTVFSPSELINHLQQADTAFEVKAGDTVWFGPANGDQATLLTFTGKTAGTTNVGAGGVTAVDSFGSDYKIYSYTATQDGTVTVPTPAAYADRFLISLGQPMDTAAYYGYVDNQKGINLYDSKLDQSDLAADWTGAIAASDAFDLTHAIPVVSGQVLTVGPVSTAQVVQGYAYDQNGAAVELINQTNMTRGATFAEGMVVLSYRVPKGVAAVRFNVPTTMEGKYLIMKGQNFTVAEYTAITGIADGDIPNPFANNAGLFAGDSINHGVYSRDEAATTFPDGKGGWAARIRRDTGMIVTNAGTSGWYFCNYDHATYDSIHKLLDGYTETDFRYVLLEGGTNDVSKMSSVGTVSDSFDPATFDQSTFAGGLEYTIYKAIQLYGDNAAIGYTSVMKLRNDKAAHAQIYAVAEEICEKWGISYLDMYNNEALNTALAVDTDEHTNDGTHPDASGYEIITPYVIEYMKNMRPCSYEVLNAVLG